jgi:DNA-binding phage protein
MPIDSYSSGMLATMADTTEAERLLQEVNGLLERAIASGDNVSAIALRAGIPRPRLSNFRNGTFDSYPKLDTVEAIAKALGYRIHLSLEKEKA